MSLDEGRLNFLDSRMEGGTVAVQGRALTIRNSGLKLAEKQG